MEKSIAVIFLPGWRFEMTEVDIRSHMLSEVEIYGRLALFTDLRVKRDKLPDDIYCYDMRHGDDMGEPVTVEDHVTVNHFGTILTTIPMDFGGSDYLPVDYEKFWFTGERMTVAGYREKMCEYQSLENFEYKGFHYVPLRKFDMEEKKMSLRDISKYLVSSKGSEVGNADYGFNDFYKASGDSIADIFLCVENGKQYIPCENELMEYRLDCEVREKRR